MKDSELAEIKSLLWLILFLIGVTNQFPIIVIIIPVILSVFFTIKSLYLWKRGL